MTSLAAYLEQLYLLGKPSYQQLSQLRRREVVFQATPDYGGWRLVAEVVSMKDEDTKRGREVTLGLTSGDSGGSTLIYTRTGREKEGVGTFRHKRGNEYTYICQAWLL